MVVVLLLWPYIRTHRTVGIISTYLINWGILFQVTALMYNKLKESIYRLKFFNSLKTVSTSALTSTTTNPEPDSPLLLCFWIRFPLANDSNSEVVNFGNIIFSFIEFFPRSSIIVWIHTHMIWKFSSAGKFKNSYISSSGAFTLTVLLNWYIIKLYFSSLDVGDGRSI